MIRDVRVFDGERVYEHRNVLVDKGTISRIGGTKLQVSQAEIVDGRGRTLLPGLFDAHLHIPQNPDAALHQLASFGVTTVLDMFGGGEKLKAKKRIMSEDPPDMADARASGFGATAPGSALGTMMRQLPPISQVEQAPAWVDARIAESSDYIKVIYDDRIGGPLNEETLRALVQAAHQRRKLVVVHVLAEQKAREAIVAGADGLAHLFLGDSAGGGFGQLAAKHHVFVIPTLITFYSLCGKPQGPELLADSRLAPGIPEEQRKILGKPGDSSRSQLCKGTDEAMHQLIKAHVPILAGTDTAPSNQMGAFVITGYGATLHGELKLLVEEGMTPVQALAAATSVPARAFRFSDRGRIRPGMRADLLLVEGNPTRDILATRNIVAVWKRGVRIQR
jgi:imidazolonepropionase-like amidohydrolase